MGDSYEVTAEPTPTLEPPESPLEPPPAPPTEVPEELQELKAEAEAFLTRFRDVFATIAGDRSLRYRIGNAFLIDLEGGTVYLDIKDFQWAKERGLSEWQIVWSVGHELAHFRDLTENPEAMRANFLALEERAAELAPQVIEIWRKQYGDELPKHLTTKVPFGSGGKRRVPFAQAFLYRKLHLLANALDDAYVNQTIGLRAAPFGKRGSQAHEVERLYRDYLFPTHREQIGEPPAGGEPADYTALPKSAQLAHAILRTRMVPDQTVVVDPEVRAILDGYADDAARRLGITFTREVASMTTVARKKARDPGWRYEKIRTDVAPIYERLLLEDLARLPPPKPPGKGPQGPWQETDGNPEPIDLDAIEGFITQKAAKDQRDAARRGTERREVRMTPDERAAAAEVAADQRLCEEHAVDPQHAAEYRRIAREVDPYRGELARVFDDVLRTIDDRIRRTWEEGYRSGRFNVDRFVRKYGTTLALERDDLIPWDALDVYDQREFTRELGLVPNRIRVRLVIDDSRSMEGQRMDAAKRLMVLFLESLASLEATANLRYAFREPLRVDTEVWVFGDSDGARRVKSFVATKANAEEEYVDRYRAIGAMTAAQRATCDAEPLWAIAESLTLEDERALTQHRSAEFVFTVTDGGSNAVSRRGAALVKELPEVEEPVVEGQHVMLMERAMQDTRNAIAAVERKGPVVRAFQIGTPHLSEQVTFNRVWGDAGARVEAPADLPGAVARVLADRIRTLNFTLEAYGGDEEE